MMTSARSFGAWLRQQRRLLDLTQSELAQRVGCAVVTIRKFEADELRPSKQMAERLALCLGVVPDEVVGFTAFARATPPLPPQPPTLPLPHPWPLPLTPLLGRTTALADLAGLLADPAVRLLTLLGAGGIGKTRLALAAAARQVEHFPQGVYFVELAGADSADALIPLIAERLDFTFYEQGTPQQQLCDYLRPKAVLLVLDNFEHLLDNHLAPELNSVALLLGLLQAAPRLKLLVTSRARLNVQAEYLYPLAGIDFPQAELAALSVARQSSAVQLFMQSARRVQNDFALTDDNVAAVVGLCRLVEGMPLAILLAAAWVEMMPPAQILAQVSHHFDFLATDLRDVPDRQRSLRAVFDHSWRLLRTAEQTLFAQLSIFRAGFTQEAMQAVTGASPPTLLALVRMSLVRRQAAGRYDLHELVRQYASERLTQTPVLEEATAAQHSHFFCARLGHQAARLQGAEQQAAMLEIETELDNLRTAWQWAVTHTPTEQLAGAMGSLGLWYRWRSRYAEGEALYRHAVHSLQAHPHPSPATQWLVAQALAWQSLFLRHTWQLTAANGLLQQSLATLEQLVPSALDTHPARAFTLLQMGRLGETQAEFALARQRYQQALVLYQQRADGWGEANVLAGLGEVARRAGDFQQARQQYEASLARYRGLGDPRGCAHVLAWLGFVLREQAQFAAAAALTQESITLYAALGDRAKMAAGQFALGWDAIYAGRFAEAYRLVESSIALQEEVGLPTSLSTLGLINVELGNYQTAQQQLQSQLARSRLLGDKDDRSLCLDVLSCLAIVEARYTDAHALLTEDLALHQEIGEQHRLAHSLAWWGYTQRGLGQHAAAARYFFQALALTVTHPGFSALLFTLPGIALLLADGGEPERAIEIYAQIADLPMVANSQMRWDLAGAHLAAVAAALPPAVVTAARTRGQAGDLWTCAAALLVELRAWGWEA